MDAFDEPERRSGSFRSISSPAVLTILLGHILPILNRTSSLGQTPLFNISEVIRTIV